MKLEFLFSLFKIIILKRISFKAVTPFGVFSVSFMSRSVKSDSLKQFSKQVFYASKEKKNYF